MGLISWKTFRFVLLFLLFGRCLCWDSEELELFDVVEEVNQNFYDVLEVDQSAPIADIRKAYRKLSRKFHPDRNKDENAEVQFRQLVAVYEILKDDGKRKRYDEILVHGLPDWRQPVFYYRRVRKLGLLEMSVLLLIILTVGHFLVVWSIYFEKRFNLEEAFKEKPRKKKDKKGRKARQNQDALEQELHEELESELSTVPKPRWSDLVPCKLVKMVIHVIRSVPLWIQAAKEAAAEKKMRAEEEQRELEEEDSDEVEEAGRGRRRQRVHPDVPEFIPEMADNIQPVVYMPVTTQEDEKENEANTKRQGKVWTSEDMALLAKAVAKFPSGTVDRWEKIADMANRTVSEVISKSKEIKSGYAISVDPSAQGTTGALGETVTFKKGISSTENIAITAREEWGEAKANGASNKKMRIKKPVKPIDTVLSQKGSNVPNLTEDVGEKIKKDNKSESPAAGDSGVVWTQNQQKILEWALSQYPKGTAERWDKIAEHIPGKNKTDCMTRFKYLADMVRQRKHESNASPS